MNHGDFLHQSSTKNEDSPLSNERVVPVKGIRKAIAQNMVTSVSEIPHGWMMVEADATNLVQTRNYHKAQFKRMKFNFLCVFVKAVAEALKQIHYSIVHGKEMKLLSTKILISLLLLQTMISCMCQSLKCR